MQKQLASKSGHGSIIVSDWSKISFNFTAFLRENNACGYTCVCKPHAQKCLRMRLNYVMRVVAPLTVYYLLKSLYTMNILTLEKNDMVIIAELHTE